MVPQTPAPLAPALRRPPLLHTTGIVDTDALGQGVVFLRPGDWFFGGGALRVTTLLGSCVALVLWSPRLQVGAMCHCLLPERPRERPPDHAGPGAASRSPVANPPPDGRYGHEAGQWLQARFAAVGCGLPELQVSLAGGAAQGSSSIGPANIAWAQQWAQHHGLRFVQQDVGGRVVRRLAFNTADGSLTVAHGGRLGPMET